MSSYRKGSRAEEHIIENKYNPQKETESEMHLTKILRVIKWTLLHRCRARRTNEAEVMDGN